MPKLDSNTGEWPVFTVISWSTEVRPQEDEAPFAFQPCCSGILCKLYQIRSLVLLSQHLSRIPEWEALDRQEMVPANNSGEQVDIQVLIYFFFEMPLCAKAPKQLRKTFFFDLLVSYLLSVSGEISKPYSLNISGLDVAIVYGLWKNWMQRGRMKWDSKHSLNSLPLFSCIVFFICIFT